MVTPMSLTACVLAASSTAAAGPYQYHDWQANLTNINSVVQWNYSSVSSAGTITGKSVYPGFVAAPGAWGMPTAITNHAPFANAFQINGATATGSFVEFNFSSGYAWGSGGGMILGGIHNHYEYEISAWDSSNNQIDVNTWAQISPEYSGTAPGAAGWFSNTTTNRYAVGNSSRFYVNDLGVDPNIGNAGVFELGGLQGVSRLRMTLTSSTLAPNAQAVDLIFMWVGTPVPAPACGGLLCAATILAARRRR